LEVSDAYRAKIQNHWNGLIEAKTFQVEVAERTLQPFKEIHPFLIPFLL
jgi:hypothetical protein